MNSASSAVQGMRCGAYERCETQCRSSTIRERTAASHLGVPGDPWQRAYSHTVGGHRRRLTQT